jgi:hypothetical protein
MATQQERLQILKMLEEGKIKADEVRVNVRLPVGLIKAGAKFGAKFSPEIEGLDIDELMSYIDSGEMGQIVDVQDEEDGEHVEVFIE